MLSLASKKKREICVYLSVFSALCLFMRSSSWPEWNPESLFTVWVMNCSRYLICLSFDQCLFISMSLNCILSLERWLIEFQLHEWKPFALKYFRHPWGKWSWDFTLVSFSMLFVLRNVVRRIRFGAHTHDSGVMTEVILIAFSDDLLMFCLIA